MPLIRYKSKNFRADARSVIAQANTILAEYARQGYDLTLRQLYYQFVARDLLPNTAKSYNKLGNIISDARLAGLIDWDQITDRGRYLRQLGHWNDPGHAIADWTRRYFNIDLWKTQPYRVEVWIEKDALVGVIGGVCNELDIPYLSCRGYTSQSEMWGAAQRILGYMNAGQDVRILHLGDHDPSGVDMTRDIEDRLELFLASHAYWGEVTTAPKGLTSRNCFDWVRTNFSVDRLALNMDQVEEYDPPPNFAKITDSRANSYIDKFGDESWELDALPPNVLEDLIRDAAESYMDRDAFDDARAEEDDHKATLKLVADRWADVEKFVKQGDKNA